MQGENTMGGMDCPQYLLNYRAIQPVVEPINNTCSLQISTSGPSH
jgi:hypothetical protein